MTGGEVSTIIGAGGLAINAVVLVFLLAQVRLLREQVTHAKDAFVFEHQRQCRQSTLEFMAATMSRRHELADQVPSETSKGEVLEFLEKARRDPQVLARLWSYLNYYEVLASGVNEGVFDVGVVDRTSGTIIVKIEELYRGFVEETRKSEGRPRLYLEIESLAKALRARRDSSNATPVVPIS